MKNFLNTLKKYRTSSIINILGLAAAFTALYIIMVQVKYDFTYNRSIKDAERIYLFSVPSWDNNAAFTSWLSRPIAENSIKGGAMVESYGTGSVFNSGEANMFIEKNGSVVQLNMRATQCSLQWIEMFDFKAKTGNLAELGKPKTCAVSESIAKKHGIELGQTIYMWTNNVPDNLHTVVAIFEDKKGNNDLDKAEFLYDYGNFALEDWSQWSYNYYVKLKSTQSLDDFYQYAINRQREMITAQGQAGEDIEKTLAKIKPLLTPITEVYFNPECANPGRNGNKTTSFTLLSIGILVLLIALINFVNFFFALVPVRIRAVNTRKIFGCGAVNLRMGFILEAIGIIVIALIFTWAAVHFIQSLSFANNISASLSILENIPVAIATVVAALIIALLGSIYPSFYITSFPMAMVVRGSFSSSKRGVRLRIILIGLQFVISMGLIIGTLLIKSQHSYMMNYNMGFNKENLYSCYITNKIARYVETRESFSAKLKTNPEIKNLAFGSYNLVSPGRMGWGRQFKGEQISLQCTPVSWDFLRLMEIEIEEGRDFSIEDELKENGTFIINRQAAKEYGITLEDKLSGHAGPTEIAGICKDFNFKPLQYGIAPFVFYVFGKDPWQMPNHMYLRTTPNANIQSIVAFIQKTILEYDPNTSVEEIEIISFDQELSTQYANEQKLVSIISVFALFSIIISLMGVFGLVMFETQYRQREIGLRRVHGASIVEILSIFNTKFIKIVLVCFVIAAPLSYIAVDKWLESFSYRTPIHWWIFALALIMVLAITVIIVTIRSMSAATKNPVDVIKSE